MSTSLPENARHEGTCSFQSNTIQIQIVNKTEGTFSNINSAFFCVVSVPSSNSGIWFVTGVSSGSKCECKGYEWKYDNEWAKKDDLMKCARTFPLSFFPPFSHFSLELYYWLGWLAWLGQAGRVRWFDLIWFDLIWLDIIIFSKTELWMEGPFPLSYVGKEC